MNEAASSTMLRFTGDWSAGTVFTAAIGLAVVMFFFYRRELRFHSGTARWLLPLLRSLAVFLIVLCLAGPVLRKVTSVRQLGRVVLVADTSASMSFTDDLPATRDRKGPQSPESSTRFKRMQETLLNANTSLLRTIAEDHDVELFSLRGYKAERIWWHRDKGKDTSGELPGAFPFQPEATITNLDQPLRDALGPSPAGTALVVFTDGQHNGPGSPEELALGLKDSGIPIFTVGYGSEAPPPDLALLNVTAPEAVFAEDRAEGTVLLNDSLAPGLPAMATISQLNKVLWQQPFTTDGKGERTVSFSFPVKELSGDPKQTMRLLNVRVELTGTSGVKDAIAANNSRTVSLHLLTRKRKVLILDGRPRWETRYLHNHFDRDERWEVSAAFDDFKDGLSATMQEVFPKKTEDLLAYDLIVLGDVRPDALSTEQQSMIVEFVEKRGGGLILVDGQRRHLQAWEKTKAAALMPVSWSPSNPPTSAMTYALATEGQSLEGLRLSDAASTNVNLWGKLPQAYWCASAKPLPDATTVVKLNSTESPNQAAVVWRRFGAGSVLWLGTDEFWRWRYEAADTYHQRFWMQIASWIAAPPFLVENDRVGLGTDRLRYQEGDTSELRVRLKDSQGNIVSTGSPRAHVFRNGQEIASLQLEPDPSHGGIFRAITGSLSSGDYHVTVTEGSLPASDLKLAFRVESQANQEWSQLTLNRPLLEGMSRASGGRFLREGDVAQLPSLLKQLDRQETRTREINLWSSWWWFTTAMVLLTAEWLLRKKWRLV